MSKFCKQEKTTCKRCAFQHDQLQGKQCDATIRCFHCHSNEHDASSKECPEYIRNALIKETMVFQNLTFTEANKEYPRTESRFRLAEKTQEFSPLKKLKERPIIPRKPSRTSLNNIRITSSSTLVLSQLPILQLSNLVKFLRNLHRLLTLIRIQSNESP